MTHLFTRIKNVIMADLHEMLDKKEQQNPIALLNEYLRQCEREVEKTRHLLERHYLLKEELTREYHHAKELAEKRKNQAQIASQAGESELYQFVAHEQAKYEERALHLKESLQQTIHQLEELERKYEEMKHKLKDMQIRRMELMGRENAARAHHRMNRVLEAEHYGKPYSRFIEIEQYLERLEQKVKADYYSSTIDARIAQLERELKKQGTDSNL
ncbi:PspA/IM30 family protein [Thermaerobacillus caldiproteolyticus]|uniref:Phage shock protein A n=1 Tax=Thermaerobacillus caldiproteolyticus TaxID=247480 RepID=A0A7W0BZR5_9BACL|nr:PspA/IM30 family protein [Anoxybacillus caldiproteolyticus]MBA2874389.1 phage shock protein A [Anoxybacillus caldiproteolyticus]QPA30905.1 PspA/IM30 family protein [Anoxybacillus caldiproteolyticus]